MLLPHECRTAQPLRLRVNSLASLFFGSIFK